VFIVILCFMVFQLLQPIVVAVCLVLLHYHAHSVAALRVWGRLWGRVDDERMC